MNRDFTLEKYTQLCDTIKRLGCPVVTIKQFLESNQPQRFMIVLRHDVDRALSRAVKIADLEASYGLQATYYVRKTPAVFRESELKYLHHYEVLTKARGDRERAIALFDQELKHFRRIVPISTISMHGSPLRPWNNLDLWQTYDCKAYDLIGEAYLSIDYSNLYYFTDTGRSWDAGRYNIRDRVARRQSAQKIYSTDDLINFLTQKPDSPVFINAHPNRWSVGWPAWAISFASDWAINQVKWVISLTR
jgi:hypothetical protein